MIRFTFILLLFGCGFIACDPDDRGSTQEVTGMVPIYSNDASIKQISAEAPRASIKGGKMYTNGNYLFQVEPDSGIHVINYSDPQHPQKVGFIRSLQCKEVSVKNGFIYTNNFSDLVVIDARDINNVHEVSRTENVFPDLNLQYPLKDANNFSQLYFECPDPSKGVIIGWKEQTIKNPKCWR